MAGDTITNTPPTRWVCPTPDLDLSDVEWTTYTIEPGTPYVDEPSEMIPPGKYIHGRSRDEDDPRDASPYILHIDEAFDEHGCDQSALLAQYVMATLNFAGDAERKRKRPSRLRRLGNRLGDGFAAILGEWLR
jgi:hypothetical protein